MPSYDYLRSAVELGVANVEHVLTRLYQLEGTVRGDEFDMLCPVHEDTSPSVSVNLVTGFWHCFACGVGGDLVRLGRRVLPDSTDEDIEDLLHSRTTDALIALLDTVGAMHRRPASAPELPVPHLDAYPTGPLRELRRRGFTAATLSRWNVRYVPEQALEGQNRPFTIRASIGLPICDADGDVIAWCYRRTEASPEWQPRYLYTTHAPIADVWFGMQLHSPDRSPDIVVVEGALDAMWCDQCGIPAVAMLGSSMTGAKLGRLASYDSVTVLGDFDAAGAVAVRTIGQACGSRVPVRVARYARWMRGTDPQELSPVDLELIVERAESWPRFVARQELTTEGLGATDHGRTSGDRSNRTSRHMDRR